MGKLARLKEILLSNMNRLPKIMQLIKLTFAFIRYKIDLNDDVPHDDACDVGKDQLSNQDPIAIVLFEAADGDDHWRRDER